MSTPPKAAVRDVLARRGIDPDGDAADLVAALAARGWTAQVEDHGAGGSGGPRRRCRALATRSRSPAEVADGDRGRVAHDHRQASGRTAEAALGRVLAAVLEQDG